MICQSDFIYVVSHLLFLFVFIFMDGAWEIVNKSSWMWEIFLGAQKGVVYLGIVVLIMDLIWTLKFNTLNCK